MHVLYLVSLIGGLLAAVYAMLYGMHRRAAVPGAPRLPGRTALLNWTVPAAALIGFGAVGAIAQRVANNALPFAGLGAALTAALQVVLSRWALTAPEAVEDQLEHRLQGHPARVTSAIAANGVGRIRFEFDGAEQDAPARAIDAVAIDAGDDVVIDRRADDGTIIVERWATVETRL
ncbi:MAG: hypothetical protein MUF00_11455 [Gemmatimonadaceae bacterium]|jgi:hypothetical protein|nr:hypothetical protein [Gemmatimonadaceae bacterium]